MGYVDLWATDRPAWGQNTSCRLGQCHPESVPVAYGGASGHKGGIGAAYSLGPDEIYEETLLRDRVLAIIEAWNQGDLPLFINYDSHVAHSPLQAPESAFERFAFIANKTGPDGAFVHTAPTPIAPRAEVYRRLHAMSGSRL